MVTCCCGRCSLILLGILAIVAVASDAAAQESRSELVARELVQLMDTGKLESIAAKDPSDPDRFVAGLYFSGLQLLIVSAKYSAPALLTTRLSKKEFRDVYVDLNSASDPKTKIFIEDLSADGLRARPKGDGGSDTWEAAGKRIVFDGDRKKQNLSDKEYDDGFAKADAEYAKILALLVAAAK